MCTLRIVSVKLTKDIFCILKRAVLDMLSIYMSCTIERIVLVMFTIKSFVRYNVKRNVLYA